MSFNINISFAIYPVIQTSREIYAPWYFIFNFIAGLLFFSILMYIKNYL